MNGVLNAGIAVTAGFHSKHVLRIAWTNNPDTGEATMSQHDHTAELDGLRTELAELRARLDHLTSGTAELTLARLAITDDNGDERIVAETYSGEDEALLQVRSGDASVFLHSSPSCGDHVTIGVDGTGLGADLDISGGANLKHGPAARINFSKPDGSGEHMMHIDASGVHGGAS